jgi:hypothetical protein
MTYRNFYHVTKHRSLHGWIINTKSNTGSFRAPPCRWEILKLLRVHILYKISVSKTKFTILTVTYINTRISLIWNNNLNKKIRVDAEIHCWSLVCCGTSSKNRQLLSQEYKCWHSPVTANKTPTVGIKNSCFIHSWTIFLVQIITQGYNRFIIEILIETTFTFMFMSSMPLHK